MWNSLKKKIASQIGGLDNADRVPPLTMPTLHHFEMKCAQTTVHFSHTCGDFRCSIDAEDAPLLRRTQREGWGIRGSVHGTGDIRAPARDSVFVQYHEQLLGRAVSGAQAKHVGLSPTPPSALEVMVNPCPDLNKIACQITQATYIACRLTLQVQSATVSVSEIMTGHCY